VKKGLDHQRQHRFTWMLRQDLRKMFSALFKGILGKSRKELLFISK